MRIVKIYTDGSCSGNPGPGGWAMVVNLDKECKRYSGGEISTTNNRMELTAVIQCLKKILRIRCSNTRFEVYSDSAYVVNAINNGWLESWRRNGWCNKRGDPVKNKDLWEQASNYLYQLVQAKCDVVLIKVKGHAGDTFNELCDKLAKEAAMTMQTRK